MKLNSNLMTAIVPSSLGMPACAHVSMSASATGAFGTDAAAFATTTVVRERQAGVEGGEGLAIAYVPGTRAWRPPSS